MGIHHEGNFWTKTQQEALFENCARNGIYNFFEHTVQDNYGAMDTHTFPILCN